VATISPEKQQQIAEVYERTRSTAQTTMECGVGAHTVRRYRHPQASRLAPQTIQFQPAKTFVPEPTSPASFLPEPDREVGGIDLPLPEPMSYKPYILDFDGTIAAIFDVHVPYHDMESVRGWVGDAKRSGATTILLGGDILDCHTVSRHPREMTAPRLEEELSKGRQLLEYLRSSFPRARIVYKEGNHEERLAAYLASTAPVLAGLPDLQLPALLRADKLGIEWVGEARPIYAGKLTILHGHEYQGSGGDRPGQWIYNKARESVLCGHFHKQDAYTFRTVRNNDHGGWSSGCACYIHPRYRRLNQWTNGWVMIEPLGGGNYKVRLERVLNNGDVV
jgi:hypothetical protein